MKEYYISGVSKGCFNIIVSYLISQGLYYEVYSLENEMIVYNARDYQIDDIEILLSNC